MIAAPPIAHTKNSSGKRQDLREHLINTSRLAGEFGAAFGAAEDCELAGLWHDIGKASPEFQKYLEACEANGQHGKADHKTAGAVLAATTPAAAHLTQIILGHHGGLPDKGDAAARIQARRTEPDVTSAIAWATAELPSGPRTVRPTSGPGPDLDIRLRLVASALVDADFLDTEAHFDLGRTASRSPTTAVRLTDLADREADAHQAFLARRTDQGGSSIDGIREEIRTTALASAALPPGLFRLTVPTGGGKTLTGLAFALQHALHHDLRRIVVAMPFITVTDQTAEVYRGVLGDNAVLEHHSGIDLDRGGLSPAQRIWARLAAENWDTPVVVTTSVQLLESLFANRPSALRKVHRLARSVIILDEAQALRLAVLGVTVEALSALARVAGASIVFCTATQPAIEEIDRTATGQVREIIPNFTEHFAQLKRVSFAVPARYERWSWHHVAHEAVVTNQSLVIVNRRRDALAVLDYMPSSAYHLSTLLCGAHRRAVLARVKARLTAGKPCHLVATQVVEAGVDIDFPLVLRALAPFDAVIQAAGRCNREARAAQGHCIVFRPEDNDSFGEYRRGQDVMRLMLDEGDIDFADPNECDRYFRHLYGAGQEAEASLDPDHLRDEVRKLNFATVAKAYHLIEDSGSPVAVLYPAQRRRIEGLLTQVTAATEPGRARWLLRQLQPYLVTLRPGDLSRAQRLGYVTDRGGLLVWTAAYDPRIGVGAVLQTDRADGGRQP
jgi:CRISPR-associated endonuclease/helicase Cas3